MSTAGVLKEMKTYHDLEKKIIHNHYFLNEIGGIDGEFKSFHVNGQLRVNQLYISGRIADGIYDAFHDNGKLATREVYKNYNRNGVRQEFSPNGQMILDECYIDNTNDFSYPRRTWSPQGTPLTYMSRDSTNGLGFYKLQKDMENQIEMHKVKDGINDKKMEEMMNLLKELSNKVKISSIDPTEIQPGEK